MVHDSMCRSEISCHFWWDVVSGHSSNGNCTPIFRRVFQVKELPVYFQEALPSRINPNLGRTPFPLLLLAPRHWLSLPLSDLSIPSRSPIRLCSSLSCWPCACSGIYHELSFLGGYCGCGLQNPLLRRRIECSFVFLFLSLKIFLASFPRISAGASP